MIRLPDIGLSATATTELSRLQSEIDALPDYEARVAKADQLWDRKPRRTFYTVRRTLSRMSGKLRRCNYCEDSLADEVEHIRPKTLYPELAFVWANYLFACGNCNPEKRDKFAVFPEHTAQWIDVQRKRNAAIVPPVAGDPVLIDPRREDPLYFLFLDLRGTFEFRPYPRRTERETARADYTIDILGLNTRTHLPHCRRDAYVSFRAKLREYATDKQAGASSRTLRLLKGALKRSPHQTVWKEMQRQGPRIAELSPLFERVPEALNW